MDSIVVLENGQPKPSVRHAYSLCDLIDNLVNSDGSLNAAIISIFFATYRQYSNGPELLRCLEERGKAYFTSNGLTGLSQTSVSKILAFWTKSYPGDFSKGQNTSELSSPDQLSIPNPVPIPVRPRAISAPNITNLPSDIIADNYLKNCIVSFETFSDAQVAEQLTRRDAVVFKAILPHELPAHIISERPSVAATISAFNSLCNCVEFTILTDLITIPERAHNVDRWIQICMELRHMKSFSSLKAIIAALQTAEITRLNSLWSKLPRASVDVFDDLSALISIDNNSAATRILLTKEGTAKQADLSAVTRSPLVGGLRGRKSPGPFRRRIGSTEQQSPLGTIPFLGTFLNDLEMLNTALPTFINENGRQLINFDKCRKQFEIMSEVQLYQKAAALYCFELDPLFDRWFDNIPTMTSSEYYQLSCQIEPMSPVKAISDSRSQGVASRGLRRVASALSSLSSSASKLSFYHRKTTSGSALPSSLQVLPPPSSTTVMRSHSANSADLSRDRNSIVVRVSWDLPIPEPSACLTSKALRFSSKAKVSQLFTKCLEVFPAPVEPFSSPDECVFVQTCLDNREVTLKLTDNLFYALAQLSDIQLPTVSVRPKDESS